MAHPIPPTDLHLDLLIKSLDTPLGEGERQQLDAALAERADLRTQQGQLLALRQALTTLHPEPDAAFTARVMADIRYQNLFIAPITRLWPMVAVAASVALVLGLTFIYYHSGSLDADALLGLDNLDLEDAFALGQ